MKNALTRFSFASLVSLLSLHAPCLGQDTQSSQENLTQEGSDQGSPNQGSSNAKFYKFKALGEQSETSALFSAVSRKLNSNLVTASDYLEGQTEMPSAVRTKGEDLAFGAENWDPAGYCWASPAFCHKPLYFEQPNLERYGKYPNCAVATIGSVGHFYSTALLLPAKFALHPCWQPSCTLGNRRPGDCNPKQR